MSTRLHRSRARPRSLFRRLTVAGILAGAAACRGGGEPGATRQADSPGAAAVDTAPAPAAGAGSPDSPDSAAATAPPSDPGPTGAGGQDVGSWERPPLRRSPPGSETGVALLTGVRTGRHAGYDRIVFEFGEHLPEYTIRYRQDPVACGSGDRVDAGGAAALEIDLRPAAAHDDEGNPTITERLIHPGLPALRSARLTCDFEAIVTWVLGLGHRTSIRVLELSSPARLVLDVRHR